MRIPEKAPSFEKLVAELHKPERFSTILQSVSSPTSNGLYLHWDELRFRKAPGGLTREEWWLGLKMRRQTGSRTIPLKDLRGHKFQFTVPDLVTELLHQIDRGGGTLVEIPQEVTNPEQRDRYLVRSLMEEAITSSQLEGAATT